MLKRRDFVGSLFSTGCVFGRASSTAKENQKLFQPPDYRSTGVRLLNRSNPSADGFYFPAEWEPHEATLMCMPPPQNWRSQGFSMQGVQKQWARVINVLSEYEPVILVVDPRYRASAARGLRKEIEIREFPLNDGWARDSGPMFLVDDNGNRRVAGFTFNGWGGKFPPYRDDALLKARICHSMQTPMYPINLCLEGGAVASDGDGTLLTTERCLLHGNRNERPNAAQIETTLCQSLGAEKVIWLEDGLVPDPITDGHIDSIAAFVEQGVVMVHSTDDRSDPNYRICKSAIRRLSQTRDAKGRQLEIIELPLDGDISHMNFYIANDCVLVPVTTSAAQDARPMAILKEAFPDRDVLGIDCRLLGDGGGGIHCITQQTPKV